MEATDDMYIISRIGTTNIDGTKSINIDGTNSSLVYTWQYMGQLSVEPVFSRKFDEI
jgi:hypothetical protein